MSRLDELKKQYPHLNMSIFDIMTKMDNSGSYKYLALLCKLFSSRFDPKEQYLDPKESVNEIKATLEHRSISTNGLNDSEIFALYYMSDYLPSEYYSIIKDFIHYMDKNKIYNKDVTTYKGINDMRMAISLASIKELDEKLANEVVKEFEDNTWLVVRPLTFSASVKYGASTKWCTTYQKEKNYFEKYWRQGVLVYFINKKTGLKFAMFKNIHDKDLSFWNADDTRAEYMNLDVEDYLFPIVKNLAKSELTNKNLSSDEIQQQVHMECIDSYMLKKASVDEVSMEVPGPMVGETMGERLNLDSLYDVGDAVEQPALGEAIVVNMSIRQLPQNTLHDAIEDGRDVEQPYDVEI